MTSGEGSEQRRSPGHPVYGMQVLVSDRVAYRWLAGDRLVAPGVVDHIAPATVGLAPGPSTISPHWRSKPSTTDWPLADAGTASRAGSPPSTSWRCTVACTAPWPRRSLGD